MSKDKRHRGSENFYKLKARTNDEWVLLIFMIKNENLRRKVASIIWWDWIASGESCDELREMTIDFRSSCHYAGIESDTRNELLRLGYTAKKANKRCIIRV